MKSEVNTQNFVNQVTDALINGESVDSVHERYDLSSTEDKALFELIENINRVMVPVQPSPQFSRRLKVELLEESQHGFVWRFRKLPGRVRVAATAAILGGFLILVRRVFFGDSGSSTEEPGAIPEEV